MRFLHLLSWVAGSAWAMEPVKAQAILDMLAQRAAGGAQAFDQEDERDRRLAARAPQKQPEGGVAVVPLYGVISPRVHDVEGLSTGGGVSAESFAAAMRQLAGDPGVTGIVIDVDSPGGNVAGISEAVEAIREAKQAKPVSAVAHHSAASAAYWLASSADELIVTQSG